MPLNSTSKTRFEEVALPVWVLDPSTGQPIGGVDAPFYFVAADETALVYGPLQTAAMGHGAPAQVLGANAARRALLLTNVSDATGYFSFGDGVGLTSTNYAFRLLPGQTLELSPPTTGQALWATCASASKNVSFQEAT